MELFQGDILQVEKIKTPVLVVSKDFFNKSGQVIVCPISKTVAGDPLHIPLNTVEVNGFVLCEQLKLLDLSVRGYKKLAELATRDIMNITDAVQGIFDYYPYA